MNRFQVLGLTAFAAISLSTGCTKPGIGDDAIANDVKAKLYSNATTKSASIDVAVTNGAVTLSGTVPNSDVELEAMKVANAATGVRNVSDQLKVDATAAAQLPNAGAPQAAMAPTSVPQNETERRRHPREERAEGSPRSAPASNGIAAVAPAVAPTPVPMAPPQPVTLTVPAGTAASVRMIDGIDSGHNTAGQTFRASLSEPLMAGDTAVIPAGASVTVLLDEARDAGRIKGQSSLEVRLTSVAYHGENYKVDSTPVQETGKGGRGKSTAVRTGIGAAAGAVIGALAGGGKGAAIGSAAGAGAGFGINALTHGQQVKIPSETVLTFTLQSPLTVTPSR